jgi:hypothetical protein
MAWEPDYMANIIPSMKYITFFTNKYLDDKHITRLGKYIYNYLIYKNNTIKRTDTYDILMKYLDEYNSPYSLENEFSKQFQIIHLNEFIYNVYKMVLMRRNDVVFAIKDLRESILYGCTVNLDYYYVYIS